MRATTFLVLFILISGCDSPTSNTLSGADERERRPSDANTVNFIPLETGNYWIYERPLGSIDSTYVAIDTVINGEKHHELITPRYYSDGRLMYEWSESVSYSDSGMVIDDMFYRFPDRESYRGYYQEEETAAKERYTVLISADTTISTPAGEFDTYLYYTEEHRRNNNWEWEYDSRSSIFFAEDIGIVRKTYRGWMGYYWQVAQTTELIDMYVE